MNIPESVRGAVIKLKGKDYLQVAHRLVWFRSVHPDGCIKTEAVAISDTHAIFRAEVYDGNGKLLAQATKHETIKGFPDFIEKAETGAIGRALGIAGFGTQFMADELDEQQRLADAPVQRLPRKRSNETGGLVNAIRDQIVRMGLTNDVPDEVNAKAKSLLDGKPATAENLAALLNKLIVQEENA